MEVSTCPESTMDSSNFGPIAISNELVPENISHVQTTPGGPLNLVINFKRQSDMPQREPVRQQLIKKNCNFPRLPWQKRPHALNFHDTEMYTKVLTAPTEQNTAAKRNFFASMNEIFPRILSSRYHSMNCKSLAKCSGEGFFWYNASSFVLINQAFGPFYCHFHIVGKQSQANAFLGPYLYNGLLDNMHALPQDTLDESTCPEEFLLEPWVLLQLPFQPVIFFQWSVVLLSEALKLQKELAEFYTVAMPRRYGEAAHKLLQITEQLLQFACSAVGQFGELCDKPLNFLQKTNPQLFISECGKILPAVKFALSRECRDIIKALKRLSWSSSSDRSDLVTVSVPSLESERFESYLQRSYWDCAVWKKYIVKTDVAPNADETPSRLTEDFKNATGAGVDQREVKNIKKLVTRKIIKAGRLKGATREKIEEAASAIAPRLKCFYDLYAKYLGTSSEKGGSRTGDGGIILDLINLQSDVKVAEALGLLTQHVSSGCGPEVYVDAVECSGGPEMSYEAIVQALAKVQPSDEWSFKSILHRLKNSNPRRTDAPERDWKSNRVVTHFEARIKSLVVMMIKQMLQSVGVTFKFHVEQQFVQYILPCAVSTILLLEKERRVSKAQLFEFVELVHGLIGAYEKQQYVLEAPWSDARSPYVTFKKSYTAWHTLLDKQCEAALATKFKSSPIVTVMLYSVFTLAKEQPGEIKEVCYGFSSFLDFVLLQYYLMVSRMSDCMQRLGWGGDWPRQVPSVALLGFHGAIGQAGREMHALCELFDKNAAPSAAREKLLRDVAPGVVQDAARLAPHQLLGLLVFHGVKFYAGADNTDVAPADYDCMPFDALGDVVTGVANQDWWKVKKALAPHLKGADPLTDLSLISLEEARRNKCYAEALKKLTPKGKLFMKRAGEVTFFPVQHCRWCGLVRVEHFRLCPECRDDPHYPDIHFFCSELCESRCLDQQHIEEHARFEMVKLNICH